MEDGEAQGVGAGARGLIERRGLITPAAHLTGRTPGLRAPHSRVAQGRGRIQQVAGRTSYLKQPS